MKGNLLAAIDLETTGTQPGRHEIIQIACVPLDSDFKPHAGTRPFYTHIKPEHPEWESEAAQQKHKISMAELMLHAPTQDRVKDWFFEWWEGLRLPFKRCLIPLAHNWAFESSFLKAWLGVWATRRWRSRRGDRVVSTPGTADLHDAQYRGLPIWVKRSLLSGRGIGSMVLPRDVSQNVAALMMMSGWL